MSLAEHLAVALKGNINSVDATYSALGSGTPRTVRGSFVAPGQPILGVEANSPRFDCMLADVATPKHGDLYTISGTRYRVKGVRRDPVGGTVENELELVK